MVTETETGKDTVGGEKEMPLGTEPRTKAHREFAVTWTEMTRGLERRLRRRRLGDMSGDYEGDGLGTENMKMDRTCWNR